MNFLDEWIQTVTAEDFPQPPFSIAPGVTVTVVEKWLEYIKMDSLPRRKTGALQSQRREAFVVWTIENTKKGKEIIF